MKKINGTIISIGGCDITKNLSIGIKSSDEISLTELIGKNVEISLTEQKQEEESYLERANEAINLKEGCGKIVNRFSGKEYVCSKKKLCPECQAKLDDALNILDEVKE